jgi:hypothetical protein
LFIFFIESYIIISWVENTKEKSFFFQLRASKRKEGNLDTHLDLSTSLLVDKLNRTRMKDMLQSYDTAKVALGVSFIAFTGILINVMYANHFNAKQRRYGGRKDCCSTINSGITNAFKAQSREETFACEVQILYGLMDLKRTQDTRSLYEQFWEFWFFKKDDDDDVKVDPLERRTSSADASTPGVQMQMMSLGIPTGMTRVRTGTVYSTAGHPHKRHKRKSQQPVTTNITSTPPPKQQLGVPSSSSTVAETFANANNPNNTAETNAAAAENDVKTVDIDVCSMYSFCFEELRLSGVRMVCLPLVDYLSKYYDVHFDLPDRDDPNPDKHWTFHERPDAENGLLSASGGIGAQTDDYDEEEEYDQFESHTPFSSDHSPPEKSPKARSGSVNSSPRSPRRRYRKYINGPENDENTNTDDNNINNLDLNRLSAREGDTINFMLQAATNATPQSTSSAFNNLNPHTAAKKKPQTTDPRIAANMQPLATNLPSLPLPANTSANTQRAAPGSKQSTTSSGASMGTGRPSTVQYRFRREKRVGSKANAYEADFDSVV